tara:strand:+ start:11548 stop:11754 length:207 start_codon:yes stop_codon:yes gene_type:complete
MTFFIQKNIGFLYSGYLKGEKRRGDNPSKKWFNIYLFVHYLKSPILSPMVLLNIILGGGGKVEDEDIR